MWRMVAVTQDELRVCVCVCSDVGSHVHAYVWRLEASLGIIPQVPPILFSSETESFIDLELPSGLV